jgi:hypothetical protein
VTVSDTGGVPDRAVRAGQHQALLREVNEHVRELHVRSDWRAEAADAEWVCECADTRCLEPLSLPLEEYERIRSERTWFVVAPGDEHVWPDVERVVERHARYWVVEKRGHAAAIVAPLEREAEDSGRADPSRRRNGSREA